jgi:acetyl esterase
MQLESKTRQFLEALKAQGGPPLQERSPAEARKFLEDAQANPGPLAPAQIETRTIPGGPTGETHVHVVRPEGQTGTLPALVDIHGGGWILGSWHTHQRLVRELASRIPAIVIFVDYPPSPEARFPVAIEQAYATLRWVADNARELNIDPTRLAITGDSVGGNMATVVARLAKERGGPALAGQVLFYPVTDTSFGSASYREFAEGTNLTLAAAKWYVNAYLPDESARRDPRVAPLQATLEQLRGLPPALIITAENDVLRDEGEAYAHKLADAGVTVTATRYLGTVHDFVMLNALADTPAAIGATAQAVDWLRRLFQQPTPTARPGAVTFTPSEPQPTERRSLW